MTSLRRRLEIAAAVMACAWIASCGASNDAPGTDPNVADGGGEAATSDASAAPDATVPMDALPGACSVLARSPGAPAATWVRVMDTGSTVEDILADDVVLRASQGGRVLVGSKFGGKANVNGVMLVGPTNPYDADIFLTSLDAAGTGTWAVAFNGNGSNTPRALAVAGDGRLFLGGSFGETRSFGVKEGQGHLQVGSQMLAGQQSGYQSTFNATAFAAKLDAKGVASWARGFPENYGEEARGVGIDGTGSFLVAVNRTCLSSMQFIDGSVDDPLFVTKLASDGTTAWEKHPSGFGCPRLRDLVVDGSNASVIVGQLPNNGVSVSFGGATLDGAGAFIVKLDANGNHAWSRPLPLVTVTRAAIDPSNNIFVVGSFKGTLSLGSAPITAAHPGGDPVVISFDPSGAVRYAVDLGSGGIVQHVVAVTDGALLIDGDLVPAGDIKLVGGTDLTVPSGAAFLARVDPAGVATWGMDIACASALGVALADDGSVFLATGMMPKEIDASSVDFGGGVKLGPKNLLSVTRFVP